MRGIYRATVMGVAIAGVACANASLAVDVRTSGFFQQRFGAENDSENTDIVPSSSTDVGVVLNVQTARSTFTLAPGVRFTWDEQVEDSDIVGLRLNANASHARPRLNLSAGFSIVPDFASRSRVGNASVVPEVTAQPDDDTPLESDPTTVDDSSEIFDDEDVLRISISGNLNARYTLDALTNFSVNGFANARQTAEEFGETPETSRFGVNFGLTRQISPLSSVSISPGVTYFSSRDGEDTSAYRLSFGYNTRLREDLSVNGNVGANFVSGENGDTEVSAIFGGGISFTGPPLADPDYRIGLQVSQTTNQDNEGNIVNRSIFRLNGNYALNDRQRFGANVGVGFDTPVFGDVDDQRRLFGGIDYSQTLSRDWVARIGYSASVDDSDQVLSNFLFFQISRGFVLAR